jgi:hypothetical protein
MFAKPSHTHPPRQADPPNLSNLLTHIERDPSLHHNSRVHLKLKTTQAKMQMKKIDLAELERAAIYLLLFTPKR